MLVESKECRLCHRDLPLDEFHRRDGDKRRSECRVCKATAYGNGGNIIEGQRAPSRDELVTLNNACNLWHQPVDRSEPLRLRP
jgi:hypothetical protein